MGEEYKPYTVPYTGAGAVRTEQGWVSSCEYGAPGATSGPGNRRGSSPIRPFHYELASTTIAPASGPKNPVTPRGRCSFSSGGSATRSARTSRSASINLHGNNQDIHAIKGPDGVGFDLPKHYDDLSKLSNREIALKIGLLNIKKGSIHDDMQKAATAREVLSRAPQEQSDIRNENARQMNDVNEAIRAWESVQKTRMENIHDPGLVDMLMISQDYHEDLDKSKDEAVSDSSLDAVHLDGLHLDGKKKRRSTRS
ncbi:hypothetical protein GGR57DRAFT_347592 [Xylariaceae sp. FL1272]|nr:hypothetical protein GGR57DRAFT_347592 [Xylariaceae sp. FL1272]